jgi:hypothetical protein
MEVVGTLNEVKIASHDVRQLGVRMPLRFGNRALLESPLGMFYVGRRIVTRPRAGLMTCVGWRIEAHAHSVRVVSVESRIEALAFLVETLGTRMEGTTRCRT